MRRNIKLLLTYDGRRYFGWQKTKTGPSIEEILQTTLETILREPIELQAASRTDAGVHARGQVVNFFTINQNVTETRLKRSLNGLLPPDIRILRINEMPSDFHPTLDCIKKEYRYSVCFSPVQLPQNRFYEWHYPYNLDIEVMNRAAEMIVGKRDFTAFCNAKKNGAVTDFIREVNSVSVEETTPHHLGIAIQGPRFLYKMVRNIVGTLVYVGRGKRSLEDIPLIFRENDRALAGMTAPAHGLTLHEIFYP